MINIILFGPPGSGKGTQAEKLVVKYNLLHISTGDLFRYNLKNNTKLGLEAKKYIDKGALVPDRVTIKMLKEKVASNPKVKGYIFDGFPRTLPQSRALDRLLNDLGGVSKLLMLDVPDQELMKRLLERGKTSGRSDDLDKNIIQRRIEVYKETTFPVFNHYLKKECSVKVWGVGSLDQIFDRLCLELDFLNTTGGKKKAASSTAKKLSTKKRTAVKSSASKNGVKKTVAKKKTATKKKGAPQSNSSKSKTVNKKK